MGCYGNARTSIPACHKEGKKMAGNNNNQRLKLKQQQEGINDYLKKTHLKELFQGLLKQVVIDQPNDPFGYMYDEIMKIKQEMQDNQIDVGSTTFLTTQYTPTEWRTQ